MAENEAPEQDDEGEAADEQVPDLDVTDESGESVKGGVPTVIDG